MTEEKRELAIPGYVEGAAVKAIPQINWGDGESVFKAVDTIGEYFGVSGFFGTKNAAQAKVLALACIMEGTSPFQLIREFHIIDGKLSMRADAMLAKFQNYGGEYTWSRSDNEVATIKLSYKMAQNVEVTFTMDDAKKAKLIRQGSAWEKFPDAMLRARCTSKAMRMYAPEIVSGIYTPEEISDFGNKVIDMAEREKAIEKIDAIKITEATPADIEELDKNVLEVFGKRLDDCIAYMTHIEWLRDGEPWEDTLTEENKNAILSDVDGFRKQVSKFVKDRKDNPDFFDPPKD